MPESWWRRGIGVRLQVAPAAGTEVMIGKRPQFQAPPEKGQTNPQVQSEAYGASTIAVARRGKDACFVALWEPFEKGTPQDLRLTVLAQTSAGLLARVDGPGWSDLIAIRLGDGADTPAPLLPGAPKIRVSDYAWLRVGSEATQTAGEWGDVTAARELLSNAAGSVR